MPRIVRPLPPFTPAQIEHFWSKVDKNGPIPAHVPHLGPCWIWTAGRDDAGYGQYHPTRRNRGLAHRVAYFLHYAADPAPLLVLHACDNPPCCNPAHLFLGTSAENTRDAMLKGRLACGDRNGSRLYPESRPRGDQHHSRLHPESLARGARHGRHTQPERTARGDRNGRAKLDEVGVLDIRRRYAVGGVTLQELADEYGVSAVSVSSAVNRKTWKHV